MEGSMFATLNRDISYLTNKLYTKASMRALSHGLENILLEERLDAEIFVLFQDFKFFLQEKDKYLELDKFCKKIIIFAQNIDRDQLQSFSNTIFMEIEDGDPLEKEWDIVINHPDSPAVLSTREEEGLQLIEMDDFRIFRGFLSFSPEVASRGVDFMVEKLEKEGISYTPHYDLSKQKDSGIDSKLSIFLNQALDEVEKKSTDLHRKNMMLTESLRENKMRTLEMVKRLCYAAEYRDEDTGTHLVRLSYYSTIIYSHLADKKSVEEMRYASLMHDIGKIGIPDSILLKPGSLTDDEYESMKKHTTIGASILKNPSSGLMQMAHDIAYYHHEKWDGTGYPLGLKGEEIPLEARVVALADVFDALSSKRVYKEPFSIEKSLEIIKEGRNNHFDGRIVDIFLDNLDPILDFKEKIDHLTAVSSDQEVAELYFNHLETKDDEFMMV